eukprot:GHVU01053141.1.p2 GENE.GHVU01053141.1~~GHVU01053141.1.p2  ORF type:complete len:108 (-),score=14.88 GHVU01053141.1:362-685(-)
MNVLFISSSLFIYIYILYCIVLRSPFYVCVPAFIRLFMHSFICLFFCSNHVFGIHSFIHSFIQVEEEETPEEVSKRSVVAAELLALSRECVVALQPQEYLQNAAVSE